MDEKKLFLTEIGEALGWHNQDLRGRESFSQIFPPIDDSFLLERIHNRSHAEKQALLEIMRSNAEELQLQMQTVSSSEQAAEEITRLIEGTSPEFSELRQVIQHDHPDLASLQLWRRFAGKPVDIHTSYSADGDAREKTLASCIGITVPKLAVAESATIVQVTEPGQPRSTSLVVSVHIAVMRLHHIVADLSEAYALLRQTPPDGSYVFITGPSKTADIEAQLVHGAHGPREMHLIIIDEQMKAGGDLRGSGLFPGSS